MSLAAITFEELLADNEANAARWREWFEAHPQALDVVCDVAGSETAGELVHHIFAVQMRHAQRLLGEPVYSYAEEPPRGPEALFALERQGVEALHRFLARTSPEHLGEVIHFTARSGRQFSITRRKLYVHIMVHAIRHWAQISTLLRQNGFHPGWSPDFLSSPAMR